MAISIRQSMITDGSKAGTVTEPPPGDMDAQKGGGKDASPGTAVLWVLLGLGLMMASSEILVRGAIAVAAHFGISDLVIGLTVVAVGTSLPELASSVMAARRGEDDLALGDILRSNTFNSLMVVGVAGLIHPLAAEEQLLSRDLPVMAFLTVLLYIFCRGRGGAGRLSRVEGGILLVLYIAYTCYLILASGK